MVGNSVNVTATGNQAISRGIYVNSVQDVDVNVKNNKINVASIAEFALAQGISTAGFSSGLNFTIAHNLINVTASGEGATPLAEGIFAADFGGSVWNVKDNIIIAAASTDSFNQAAAYGIFSGGQNIQWALSNNFINATANGSASLAAGIDAQDNNSVWNLNDNQVKAFVNGSGGVAYGLVFNATGQTISSHQDVFNVSADGAAYGISGDNGGIGATNANISVTNDLINVTSTNGDAFGIYDPLGVTNTWNATPAQLAADNTIVVSAPNGTSCKVRIAAGDVDCMP